MTKLRVLNGAHLGTFSVGAVPGFASLATTRSVGWAPAASTRRDHPHCGAAHHRRGALEPGGADPHGHDIARPAEYLLDASGTIRWLNLTEDYRVRARPEQIIEQAKALR